MSIVIFRLSFHVFSCASPMVISSIFGKCFHFPFSYFVYMNYEYFTIFTVEVKESMNEAYLFVIFRFQSVNALLVMRVNTVRQKSMNVKLVRRNLVRMEAFALTILENTFAIALIQVCHFILTDVILMWCDYFYMFTAFFGT